MSEQLELETERAAVSEYGRKMLEKDLTIGTGGNVSVRMDDRVAISPSGIPYNEITPEKVPVLDIEGNKVAGDLSPSSEFRMHISILREREDVKSIVHTHSPYASTFASLGEPIPASHYLVAFVGDKIPVADYETYGTAELAEQALVALEDEYNACLLENHGVLAVGGSIDTAFEVAMMVEYCARIHYQATNIGEPKILPDEEVATLLERFAEYGQEH